MKAMLMTLSEEGALLCCACFLMSGTMVLLTGEDGEHVYMFDPYYDQDGYGLDDIQIVENCPTRYNRIVPWKYFNKIALNVYSLGPYQGREAIILFNKNTELTSEKTIEYFI